MNTPSISVIVPVLNCAERLPQLIENLLQQSGLILEILIVDYGSMDDTAEVLQPYWGAVRYFFQPSDGVAAALNIGVKEADGQWIAFLHAQDCWHAEKLREQWQAVSKAPESVGLCACDTQLDSDNELPQSAFQRVHRNLRETMPARGKTISSLVQGKHGITRSSFLARRQFVQQICGFDERLHYLYHADFLFRLSLLCDFIFLPETYVGMSLEVEENFALPISKADPVSFTRRQYVYRKWWRTSIGKGNCIRGAIAVELSDLYEAWAEMHLCNGNLEQATRALRRASRTRRQVRHLLKRWIIQVMPEFSRNHVLKKSGNNNAAQGKSAYVK